MSRRRSRLASTSIASANPEAISVGEFLKGLNRTPRTQRYQYRRGHFSSGNGPPASSDAIPSTSLAGNVDEDEFLLETLAALERADEEAAQLGNKRRLGTTRCVPLMKRRRRHAVAWGSLALSRDPQNDTFRFSSDCEVTDSDPIMTGTTQIDDNLPDTRSRPRFPVSVLRGMILSPWSGQASGLKDISGGQIPRVIPRETRQRWADQIDSALVPREAAITPIARKPRATRGGLELVNSSTCLEDDSELLPHPALARPGLSTPDSPPPSEDYVAEIDMGPELGLIKAPEKVQEYNRNTASNNSMRALSAHLRRISTCTPLIATRNIKEVASGNSGMETTSGSGASELDMGVLCCGSTHKTTGDTPSPGLTGIEPEGGTLAGGKRHTGTSSAPPGLPRESVRGVFTQRGDVGPGTGFRASDCRSQFEAQVVSRAQSVQDMPGDPESVADSPRRKRQAVTGCGQQHSGVLPDGGSPLLRNQGREVVGDRDHDISPGGWRKQVPLASPLGLLPVATPLPPNKAVAAPNLPSHRRLRILIDEGENNEMGEPLNRTYFSSAQRSLASGPRFDHHAPRRIQLATSPSRYGYGPATDSEEIDEEGEAGGTKINSANRPAIYSLSPAAIPKSARTHPMIPLKDILKRGASFQTRRPSISGIFRKPSLLPRPVLRSESTFVPATPQVVFSGQQFGARRPIDSSPFTVPSPIIPPLASETESRVKRRKTWLRSDAFGGHFSTHQGGASGYNQPITLRPRRGMTVRFNPSQKPFRPPLVRQMSQAFEVRDGAHGIDRSQQSSAFTKPRQLYTGGRLAITGGNRHADTINHASFVDVRTAW